MSARLINVDRETPLLLPPDLRDWVAKEDMVHFLIDAQRGMDLSSAVLNERGTGDRQYPPGMMLLLLIYCYSHGVMSSRQIEQATYHHVAVRLLCGDLHPDHDTIAKFRRENAPLIASAFRHFLRLARLAGLLRLGTVALDGTKIEAAASKAQTMNRPDLEAEIACLDQQIGTLLAQAEAADQRAAQAPLEDRLPPALADAKKRRAKLEAAHTELLAQEAARAAEAAARRQAPTPDPDPKAAPKARARPRPAIPAQKQRVNLHDPQSALQPTAKGGFTQGYNAQITVDAETSRGLILAAAVVRDTHDRGQLEPMLRQTVANLEGAVPQVILVDSGFENYPQVQRLQSEFGLDILLPPVCNAQRTATPKNPRGWSKERRRWRATMQARLQEPATRALYARRKTTVEPTFGTLKETMGLRRFHLRGLAQVQSEWTLACLAFNCRRLVSLRCPAHLVEN
jgi:transposase/IS5 family transposase